MALLKHTQLGYSQTNYSFRAIALCVFAITLCNTYIHLPVIVCANNEKAGEDFICYWEAGFYGNFSNSTWAILHLCVL